MHHVVLERWSRGNSFLHARDPRAKLLALVGFLIALATSHKTILSISAALFALLLVSMAVARLPLTRLLARSAVVLPFTCFFAIATWLAGDSARAAVFLIKSYLSALAVLIVVATTPMHHLLRGLETLRVPRFLLMVAQFLYRYLFVISEEAQHMRAASISRGASARIVLARKARMRAAAGAIAVLFARSYARAARIHRAMLARGFSGHYRLLSQLQFGWADAAFLAAALVLPFGVRAALETLG